VARCVPSAVDRKLVRQGQSIPCHKKACNGFAQSSRRGARLESVLRSRVTSSRAGFDFALESIAAACEFRFQFVTIVIAEDDSDVMVRRDARLYSRDDHRAQERRSFARRHARVARKALRERRELLLLRPKPKRLAHSIYTELAARPARATRSLGTNAIRCAWCCATRTIR